MLPLLAAIPSIISTISSVTDLFSKGKDTIETVTGTPSESSTPEELHDEIISMPKEQQAQWSQIMQQKIDMYSAQTLRLESEQGLIDPNMTDKLTAEAASKIAIQRQTTRPWTVRMMVHYVMFPFYLTVVDTTQFLLHNWFIQPFNWAIKPFETFKYVFGVQDMGSFVSKIGELANGSVASIPQTLAGAMYMEALPWVTGIILSYMGLREIGKHRDAKIKAGGNVGGISSAVTAIGSAVSSGLGLVDKVKQAFK